MRKFLRSNYKEYKNNVVFYKDINPTFDKVEIAASDLDLTYTKLIDVGYYNDFLDELGNVRVLATCDYNESWTTSFVLLDNKKLKGQIIDLKTIRKIQKKIIAFNKRDEKKQLKKIKEEQRRRNRI